MSKTVADFLLERLGDCEHLAVRMGEEPTTKGTTASTPNDRNELWVGWPAVKAIVDNMVIPRELDFYLAWTGYDSQQTGEPVNPNRKDNVFSPLDDDKDYGTHGSFDSRAKRRSYQLWATKNRNRLVLAGAALAAITGIALDWR